MVPRVVQNRSFYRKKSGGEQILTKEKNYLGAMIFWGAQERDGKALLSSRFPLFSLGDGGGPGDKITLLMPDQKIPDQLIKIIFWESKELFINCLIKNVLLKYSF